MINHPTNDPNPVSKSLMRRFGLSLLVIPAFAFVSFVGFFTSF